MNRPMDAEIRAGWAHYHARIEYLVDREIKNPGPLFKRGIRQFITRLAYAPSADSALRQIHMLLQRSKETDHEHRVDRPALMPQEYRVAELFIPYRDSAGQKFEHHFDIPASENPDLTEPRHREPDPTSTMDDLLKEAEGRGRLSPSL